ncbi:MAG: hypothetical protein H7Y09_08830 [Chitinophagaceae bacterium]|nr:hypothetical protein [Anaerolineae bacterium]
MSIIQIDAPIQESTNQQRLSHFLTLGIAVVLFLIGLNARNTTLLATTFYSDSQAGIQLNYPRNWIIETAESTQAFVFRVRDTSRLGYKTTIQIAIEPVGSDTTERNVLDSISMDRSTELAAYNILSIDEEYLLPDDIPAFAMQYAYVETETNPFLESLPIVVQGLDILTISRGQALIVTFRADARTFDDDLSTFNRFLGSLDF